MVTKQRGHPPVSEREAKVKPDAGRSEVWTPAVQTSPRGQRPSASDSPRTRPNPALHTWILWYVNFFSVFKKYIDLLIFKTFCYFQAWGIAALREQSLETQQWSGLRKGQEGGVNLGCRDPLLIWLGYKVKSIFFYNDFPVSHIKSHLNNTLKCRVTSASSNVIQVYLEYEAHIHRRVKIQPSGNWSFDVDLLWMLWVWMWVCVCVWVYMYVCKCVCMCVSECMSDCVYVYICVSVCVWGCVWVWE